MSKRRSQKRRRKIHYYSPKRRAVYANGDDIDHFTLFELHGWMCWVCKQPVDKRLRFPNYMAATVEHIVPISAGGTHTWDNVTCSHAKCNFDRGNSLPDESSGIMIA